MFDYLNSDGVMTRTDRTMTGFYEDCQYIERHVRGADG